MAKITALYFPLHHCLKAGKIVLFTSIIFYTFWKLWELEGFFLSQKNYFLGNIGSSHGIYLLLSLLFCPINWFLEAIKWKIASWSICRHTLADSIKAVLTGLSLNLIFPASIGHMAGRIAYLDGSSVRVQGASKVMVCQSMQMVVAVGMATISSFYINQDIFEGRWLGLLSVSCLAIVLALVFTYSNRYHPLVRNFLEGITSTSLNEFLIILVLSIIRYVTFTLQYIWVLVFLGVDLPWITLACYLSLVFMAKSLLPSFHFLSDLGVREFAALLFLPFIGLTNDTILAGSLYVWLINIFLPSLTGSFLILKMKWSGLSS